MGSGWGALLLLLLLIVENERTEREGFNYYFFLFFIFKSNSYLMVTCVREQTTEDSFVFDMSIINQVVHVFIKIKNKNVCSL